MKTLRWWMLAFGLLNLLVMVYEEDLSAALAAGFFIGVPLAGWLRDRLSGQEWGW